jgi:hypothetical protein
MSGRDWRRPKVDQVRAATSDERRLTAIEDDDRELCQRCFRWILKGQPMLRVRRGFVHDPCPPRE